MNRIDHRPMTSGLNGIDGAQLQRRALQELERQWLDSWGAASAAQSDTPSASPDQNASTTATLPSTASAAADGAHSATEAGVTTSSGRATASSKDAQADAGSVDRHVASRDQAKQLDASSDDRSGIAATFNATATPAARFDVHAAQSKNSVAVGRDAAAFTATQLAAASPTAALPSAMTALPSGQVVTAPSELLTTGAESDAASVPAASPRLPQASEGHLGPQKLTLRELAPDIVQAALRDTQLDLATSQLAAQGLARALMEAGYARVKVVVNGQHSRGEQAVDPDDSRPRATTATDPNDSFSETASKDHAHGN